MIKLSNDYVIYEPNTYRIALYHIPCARAEGEPERFKDLFGFITSYEYGLTHATDCYNCKLDTPKDILNKFAFIAKGVVK